MAALFSQHPIAHGVASMHLTAHILNALFAKGVLSQTDIDDILKNASAECERGSFSYHKDASALIRTDLTRALSKQRPSQG